MKVMPSPDTAVGACSTVPSKAAGMMKTCGKRHAHICECPVQSGGRGQAGLALAGLTSSVVCACGMCAHGRAPSDDPSLLHAVLPSPCRSDSGDHTAQDRLPKKPGRVIGSGQKPPGSVRLCSSEGQAVIPYSLLACWFRPRDGRASGASVVSWRRSVQDAAPTRLPHA